MGGLHETRGQFTVSSTEAERNGQYRDETENSPRCLLRNTTTKTKKPMLLHRSYKRLFIAFSISNSIRQNWIGPHFFTIHSYFFLKTPFTKNKLAAASFHPLRNSLANLKYNRCRAKKGEQRNEHSFLVLSSLERKAMNRALNIFLPVVYTNS